MRNGSPWYPPTMASISSRFILLPPAEEPAVEPSPDEDEDYLVRLRTLQEILSDMERELDLIIRTSSKDP